MTPARQMLAGIALLLALLAGAQEPKRFVLHRAGWSHDRSLLQWYGPTEAETQKPKGTLNRVAGWTEYDFELPQAGWYELWETGNVPGWTRDVYLDGQPLFWLTVSAKDDVAEKTKAQPVVYFKEANLYLTAGKHSLRFRRLGFPGCLPAAWELRAAAPGDPAACLRAVNLPQQVLRAGTRVEVGFLGGGDVPQRYDLLAQPEGGGEPTLVGSLEFPAGAPVKRSLSLVFPTEGVYRLLARAGDRVLRPADLKAGCFAVIDVAHPPAPAERLLTTAVLDIDCVAQTINGKAAVPGQDYFEAEGSTGVVQAPGGAYRESSGLGRVNHWGLDGFSYRFDLPAEGNYFRLLVDYPDDDRRTMGFWVNDGTKPSGNAGMVTTGGVETGDRYRLSHKLQTHEAFFYPREREGAVVAVLNLVPGLKAAAARIRIERVDSALPAAPGGNAGQRLMGFYFEESGRWQRFFGGGRNDSMGEQLLALERWGQWNRYLGANLMFPTINVYQGNFYPSKILDGYFSTPMDVTRMAALVAEKYNCRLIPEFHLSGQSWFDRHVMGVWEKDGQVNFASPEAESLVLRNKAGGSNFGWHAFGYNCLHPRVQQMYLDVFGEVADNLADSPAFAGISSRLMLGWQFQGWSALPGLNWGYDDWTLAEFEKDTGLKIPGKAGDPARFRQRFDCLTGPLLERWLDWRCQRLFQFHCRLRDRLRQARPQAKLYLDYYGLAEREAYSSSLLGQMREIGLDWRLYAKEPGLVLIPHAGYGRRFSTPVGDAEDLEPLFDPETATVARLGDRGFGLGGAYFEVNANLDWAKFGGKPYHAFDCCVPGGVHERELYAQVLANADVSCLANGGNGWMFGTPSVMQPFLAEYRALPALPFEPAPFARDPVAVWTRQESGRLLFYAVNRLDSAVAVTLQLPGTQGVTRLLGGEAVPLQGDRLRFTLEPYMLRGFAATGAGAAVAACQVETAPEVAASLAPALAFARQLRTDVQARRVAPEWTQDQAAAALALLDEALAAAAAGQYWRARGDLGRAPLVRLYDILGRYPPGLLERSTPLGYTDSRQAPRLELAAIRGDVRGHLGEIRALAATADGQLWAASPSQTMLFDAQGRYQRAPRLLLPGVPDSGDMRTGVLGNPGLYDVRSLAVAPNSRLLAARDAAVLYEPELGRVLRLAWGYSFPRPEDGGGPLAFDRQGNCYFTGKGVPGVYKYRQDGTGAFDFTADGAPSCRFFPANASGAAFDAANRAYLTTKDGLAQVAPDGQPGPVAPGEGLFAPAVTPDGEQLYALADRGDRLAAFRREGGGLRRAWLAPLPGRATALAWNGDRLLIGFREGVRGSSVLAFRPGAEALGPGEPFIPHLEALAAESLGGFTQLKVYGGKLFYLAHGQLWRLTPGTTERAEAVCNARGPTGSPESFAIAPDGSLYLAGNFGFYAHSRGVNLYRAERQGEGWGKPVMLNGGKPLVGDSSYVTTDLEADAQGRLLLRLDDPGVKASGPVVSLFRYNPADGSRERLLHLGSTMDGGRYGFWQGGDGSLAIAGGGTRSLTRLDAKGKLLWQIDFEKTQPPGTLPLRQPLGVAVDGAGRLWVTETARNQIAVFDRDGRFLASYGHFGTIDDRAGFGFCQPAGVAVLGEWLYVADCGNQRLLRYRIIEP